MALGNEKRGKMEAISIRAHTISGENESPVIDTTFVLFFLAIDLGQNILAFGLDTAIMTITLMAVIVLPYFLMTTKGSIGAWVFGRTSIAIFAILLGAMFNQGLGAIFPESFGFLPLTFLIITAVVSCYIQFYSFFRFRLLK